MRPSVMALTDLPMLNLQLDYNDSDGFCFNQALEDPPSSATGSSYADSSFGPYTPSSGRSTPPSAVSMDFASSFASSMDSFPCDFTPPPSAVSAYFPHELNVNESCDFLQPAMPATPSRNQVDFCASFSGVPVHHYGQPTPPQAMDLYSFTNGLSPSPIAPAVMQPTCVGEEYDYDMWSSWGDADSEVSFEVKPPSVRNTPQSARTVKQDGSAPMFLSTTARRRLFPAQGRAKNASAALQTFIKGARMHAHRVPIKTNLPVDSIASRPKHFCDFPECASHKGYARSEHLKRHKDTKHSGKLYPCTVDGCPKMFNRTDNRRSHMRLHLERDSKAPRVKPSPAAEKALEDDRKQLQARRRGRARGGD